MVKVQEVNAKLLSACKKAVRELNEIRARDGVPYSQWGYKSSVDEAYFSSVVDECFEAIKEATGISEPIPPERI